MGNDKSKTVLEFGDDELSILDRALQEMPYRIVSKLINDINTQIRRNTECGADQSSGSAINDSSLRN